MRRLLTTLMILLVVLVAGLSALVLMVNPNDFRDYMVREVAARSGYQLSLDGPLRWHVWPQLSILSGRMSLKAPGAEQPIVTAANMRLDVGLLPLLSHQLNVREVMVKGAVIQLSPQTEAQRVKSAPVAPKPSAPLAESTRGWSFDIGKLRVIDSLLVFERRQGDQVTMRNINLQMDQDARRRAEVTFSGSVNRNQRDLDIQFNAALDGSDYPANLNASLTSLSYKLRGADLPRQGITGQGMMNGRWSEATKTLSFNDFKITANDSDLSGEVSVILSDVPQWDISLHAQRLNLDNLLVVRNAPAQRQSGQPGQAVAAPVIPRPVIAELPEDDGFAGLKSFNASAAISAATAQWRGLALNGLDARMANQDGVLTINALQGNLGQGHFSLPGTIDGRQHPGTVSLNPMLKNISLGPLLNAFNYPQALSGMLNLSGSFSGDALDAANFRSQWQGSAAASVDNLRLEGMNFLMLVQQALARGNNDIEAQHDDETATVLKSFSTRLQLDHGKLQLQQMAGESPLMTLTGQGQLDLLKQQCDTQFAIQATAGWKGDRQLIAALQKTPIPLRIYGPWQALNYHLDINRDMRKNLESEARQRLKAWAERNKNNSRIKENDIPQNGQ